MCGYFDKNRTTRGSWDDDKPPKSEEETIPAHLPACPPACLSVSTAQELMENIYSREGIENDELTNEDIDQYRRDFMHFDRDYSGEIEVGAGGGAGSAGHYTVFV